MTSYVKNHKVPYKLNLPLPFTDYFQMLKSSIEDGTMLGRLCQHTGKNHFNESLVLYDFSASSAEISQVVPFISWFIENQSNTESLITDGNMLLVLDSLLDNHHLDLDTILGDIVKFACRFLTKSEDLNPVYRGHEITIRERSALLINKAIQSPSFDDIDVFKTIKRRSDSMLGLVIGIF